MVESCHKLLAMLRTLVLNLPQAQSQRPSVVWSCNLDSDSHGYADVSERGRVARIQCANNILQFT